MTDQSPLRTLLDLTVQQAALARRIDLVRAAIDAQARAEYAATGAAPTWKIKNLGQIRLDGCDDTPKPYIADETELAEWVAQNQPTEAIATLELAPDRLDEALEALGFASVPTLGATVRMRDGYSKRLLDDVECVDVTAVDDAETKWIVVLADGTEVPGVRVKTGGNPRLVVAPDRGVKAAAIEAVDAEVAAEQAQAAGQAEDETDVQEAS